MDEVVSGLKKVIDQLQKKVASLTQDEENIDVVVGYEAAYAVYVHEDLQAYHEVGQAKFLTQPAMDLKDEIMAIVKQSLLAGKTLAQSLLLGGVYLQGQSQKLVPIDTGNLRASAFTRLLIGEK